MSSQKYTSEALLSRIEQQMPEVIGHDGRAHYMVGWLASALVTILNNPNSDVSYLKELATNDEVAA